MGIKRFFDETITVRRLKTVSGNRQAFQTTATAECHIQSISSEARQRLGILEQRSWIAYFDVEGIYQPKVGDKITDEDAINYKVIDITKKDYAFGINQYIEVILVEYTT